METRTKPRTRPRNISVPEVIDRALEELAIREGHGNVSRLIQDMTRERAMVVFGPNWQQRFAEGEAA